MTSHPILDLIAAKEARDDGIKAVSTGSWLGDAMALLNLIATSVPQPFAVEDVRLALLDAGLQEPRHPNAWGALGMQMSKRGLTERTGHWRHATAKKSHACTVPLYRWARQ